MIDSTLLIVLLVVVGIIGFLVLGYLATNDKLPKPLLKPAKAIHTTLSLLVLLLIAGAVVYGFVEESGLDSAHERSVSLREIGKLDDGRDQDLRFIRIQGEEGSRGSVV